MKLLLLILCVLAWVWAPVWYPVRVWVDPMSEPWGHRVG